jgi:hypothetical protein
MRRLFTTSCRGGADHLRQICASVTRALGMPHCPICQRARQITRSIVVSVLVLLAGAHGIATASIASIHGPGNSTFATCKGEWLKAEHDLFASWAQPCATADPCPPGCYFSHVIGQVFYCRTDGQGCCIRTLPSTAVAASSIAFEPLLVNPLTAKR